MCLPLLQKASWICVCRTHLQWTHIRTGFLKLYWEEFCWNWNELISNGFTEGFDPCLIPVQPWSSIIFSGSLSVFSPPAPKTWKHKLSGWVAGVGPGRHRALQKTAHCSEKNLTQTGFKKKKKQYCCGFFFPLAGLAGWLQRDVLSFLEWEREMGAGATVA